jgi:hypothetical protein
VRFDVLLHGSPHVLNWLRCGEEGAWSTGMPSALFHQLVPAPMNRYTIFHILSVLHALGIIYILHLLYGPFGEAWWT